MKKKRPINWNESIKFSKKAKLNAAKTIFTENPWYRLKKKIIMKEKIIPHNYNAYLLMPIIAKITTII